MKFSSVLKIAVLAVPLMMASCRSHKKVVTDTPVAISPEQAELLDRVDSHTQRNMTFVGSKLKFTVNVGNKEISLSGNLRMKRNDVIRLQLMALGLVEAARLEFTQDYVLIMDRINKQFLKAPYHDVEFLRNSGINFNTLQALFWNELFQPGKADLSKEDRKLFTLKSLGDGEAVINFEDGDGEKVRSKMFYSWLVNELTGRIKTTNIMYRDTANGNTQLNWDYREFKDLGSKLFPSDMNVTLTTPKKEVKLGIRLNSLNNDDDWDLRTRVSSKYREVEVDEILHRIMSL